MLWLAPLLFALMYAGDGDGDGYWHRAATGCHWVACPPRPHDAALSYRLDNGDSIVCIADHDRFESEAVRGCWASKTCADVHANGPINS